MNNKIKFIFFGTSYFAAKILDIMHKKDLCPALIVTTSDKPKGRKMEITPNPVKIWAQANGKVIIQQKKLSEIRHIFAGAYDVFVVADYGNIIPSHILNIPNYGCLNIHPSLLPKFRGPSPIQSFILSDEQKTGVTIIFMDEQVDHGPIVAQQQLEISNFYYKELEQKLAELGAELLIEILPKWIKQSIKLQEQDHSHATYTQKIRKEDGLINFNDSPEKILKKIRAFTPWPGTYFFAKKNGKEMRIIITEAKIADGKLIIKKIKPEGKNEMPLQDFLRGNPDLENQINSLLQKNL